MQVTRRFLFQGFRPLIVITICEIIDICTQLIMLPMLWLCDHVPNVKLSKLCRHFRWGQVQSMESNDSDPEKFIQRK